jgi:hypothetical protein
MPRQRHRQEHRGSDPLRSTTKSARARVGSVFQVQRRECSTPRYGVAVPTAN